MDALNAASLVNIIGFIVGISLYALLGAMVLRSGGLRGNAGVGHLLLATAGLGLLWNAGELLLTIQKDLGSAAGHPLLVAASYSALGFLPSVVVHSALSESVRRNWLLSAAYLLSLSAGVLHFYSALFLGTGPSALGLQILSVGAVLLTAALLFFNYRQAVEKKALWAAALLIFAVSALHLSSPGDETSLVVELVAHQSSLPLALVILLQNYRFAFADLFLKRAISMILLALVAFGLYAFAAVPLVNLHEGHEPADAQATGIIIALWIATALSYPWLNKFAIWLVDRVILARPDYNSVQTKLAGVINNAETTEAVLKTVCDELGDTLTAKERIWQETENGPETDEFINVNVDRDRAELYIPTHDEPKFSVTLGQFEGGRRLLSDEMQMLDAVALIAARRIDALRVTHERCEQELREQQYSKLAAEAQLTALRAQINPHFLFNALTTIGYLIQTSPDKALQTLLHLTKLLRAVLSSGLEFSTIGEELDLIKNYLDIERARFEERLKVTIDVSEELERMKIPTLILQPLVENAVKHGIAESRSGGEIAIAAKIEKERKGEVLEIRISDTGSGHKETERNGGGVGLVNVRERLNVLYGGKAKLILEINGIKGSYSGIRIPIDRKTKK